MDEKHRSLLRRSRPELVEELHNLEELCDYLLRDNVFSQGMIEDILAEKTTRAKTRRLLTDLPRRGPKAFEAFISGLQQCHMPHIAKELIEKLNGPLVRGPPTHNQAQPSTGPRSDENLQSLPLRNPVQATEPHKQVSMDTDNTPCTYAGTQPNAYHGCPASERYSMESKPRGYCLIINNIKFVDPEQTRNGAEQDEKMLKEILVYLGFLVDIKNNLTSYQMLETIRNFSRLEYHSEADSCILSILSHGDEGNAIYGCDMKKLSLTEVYNLFDNDKCESLRGKPKMFLIQACRGRPISGNSNSGRSGNSLNSVSTQGDGGDTPSVLTESGDYQNVHQPIPPKADMLIALSTTEGDLAYRHTENGSWFIQALVEVLGQDSYHEEVSHMLMKVNGIVSVWDKSSPSSSPPGAESSLKQMPEFTVRLTKKWYLNPIGAQP